MPIRLLTPRPHAHRPWLRHPAVPGLLLCLALATVAPAVGTASAQGTGPRLPALGEGTSDDLGAADERRLGDRIMSELRRDPDVLDDPILVDYVQSVWRPLLAAARQRGDVSDELEQHFAWELFLVRDRSVNAFALPGGYLGVHLGLIAVTQSPDELASVLAHELSHVTQRHIARMLTVGRRQTALSVAALIVGVLAASRSPDAAQALVLGGQAAAAQGQLNFSRDMEREADRVGFGVLDSAGFAGIGMVGMFERLQQAARLNDNQGFPYLRSHPLGNERLAEARSRLGLAGAGTAVDGAASGGEAALALHAAMQGRARALMDARSETQQRLAAGTESAQASAVQRIAQAQAAVLAATRLQDAVAADRALGRLRQLAAPYPALTRVALAAQVERDLAFGRGAAALALLEGPAGAVLNDGSRSGLLLGARVALASSLASTGSAAPLRRSAQDLRGWLALHPVDAGAWELLGSVQERLGQPLAALRAQAESRWALGDLAGAHDRLRAAQRLGRQGDAVDPVELAIVDARFKTLDQLRRQRQAEEQAAARGGS